MKPIINHLGFGGAALTSMRSYYEVKTLLNLAFEQGIRHFDTAVLYGKGYSELIFGLFLKDKRQDITITTKFGLGDTFKMDSMPIEVVLPLNYNFKKIKKVFSDSSLRDLEVAYKPVRQRVIDKKMLEDSFKDSLNRLKTDYVDYYLLHEGLPSFLTNEAFDYLSDLKLQGRVRHIGIGSNILDIKTLNKEDVQDWDVLQYEGNIDEQVIEMMLQFPTKTHFHHSCLKDRDNIELNKIATTDKVGFMLAQAAKLNPKGKIIFSTRNREHLENNINSYIKFRH